MGFTLKEGGKREAEAANKWIPWSFFARKHCLLCTVSKTTDAQLHIGLQYHDYNVLSPSA